MWVPPEVKEHVLLHSPARKSVGYFGAVTRRKTYLCSRRAKIQRSKLLLDMDKASLQSALEELVDIGWLEPPQRVREIDLYRLSDHARENELFLYDINDLAKKRAYR
jgi:hypothetical protein